MQREENDMFALARPEQAAPKQRSSHEIERRHRLRLGVLADFRLARRAVEMAEILALQEERHLVVHNLNGLAVAFGESSPQDLVPPGDCLNRALEHRRIETSGEPERAR